MDDVGIREASRQFGLVAQEHPEDAAVFASAGAAPAKKASAAPHAEAVAGDY